MEKEDVLKEIKRIIKDGYVGSVICRELHQDGFPHIHCYLETKTLTLNDPHALDLTSPGGCTYHGNYQAAKSPMGSALYVIELGDYIVDNVELSTLPGRVNKSQWVYKLLSRGISDQELGSIFPGYLLQNLNKIDAIRKRMRSWKPLTTIQYGYKINLKLSSEEATIVNWLAKNLWPSSPRPLRTPQLYIKSPTEHGKSTLVENLSGAGIRVFFFPYEEGNVWVEKYNDFDFDLIVFDEFSGQAPLTFVNSFIDGSTKWVPQRGGGLYKRNNLPAIILANDDPEVYYPKATPSSLQAFKKRFTYLSLSKPISVLKKYVK